MDKDLSKCRCQGAVFFTEDGANIAVRIAAIDLLSYDSERDLLKIVLRNGVEIYPDTKEIEDIDELEEMIFGELGA